MGVDVEAAELAEEAGLELSTVDRALEVLGARMAAYEVSPR